MNVRAASGSDNAPEQRETARGSAHRDVDVLDFLPGALAVQERPPSPTGRALLWLLLALAAIALAWAAFGHVDIVVTAPGKVVPSGQVKIVQAPETASVARIHVHNGQRVDAGEVLISLDPTYAEADDARIAGQLAHNRLQRGWRVALERWLASGHAVESVPLLELAELPADDRAVAQSVYQRHQEELLARLESLQRQLRAREAELQALQEEERRVQAALAILRQRVAAYATLVEREYGARVQYLEMLQQQTELEQSIPVLQSRQQQLVESVAALRADHGAIAGEARRANLLELSRLDAERASLEQEARKARQREAQLQVVAPVSGTVQELVLHTEGGVVTPAQALMKIVPEGAPIEVEAQLANRDVGFVWEGQPAAVKVEAFSFTRYGLIDAEVLDIGDDAVQDAQGGWAFPMRLTLAADSITVDGKAVRLSPGMTVAAEVRTGQRRLIEFFLSPLLRYRQESLRER